MVAKIKDGNPCYICWRSLTTPVQFYVGTRRYSNFSLRYDVEYVNDNDEIILKQGVIEAPLLEIIYGVK